MEITSITVRKLEKEDSKIKGISTVIINDSIAIHGIRIVEGEKGLFIAMPSRKTTSDEWVDIVHPIKKETRELLHNAIINEYQKEVENEDTKE